MPRVDRADRCLTFVFDLQKFIIFGDAFIKPRRSERAPDVVVNQKMHVFVKNRAVSFFFFTFIFTFN